MRVIKILFSCALILIVILQSDAQCNYQNRFFETRLEPNAKIPTSFFKPSRLSECRNIFYAPFFSDETLQALISGAICNLIPNTWGANNPSQFDEALFNIRAALEDGSPNQFSSNAPEFLNVGNEDDNDVEILFSDGSNIMSVIDNMQASYRTGDDGVIGFFFRGMIEEEQLIQESIATTFFTTQDLEFDEAPNPAISDNSNPSSAHFEFDVVFNTQTSAGHNNLDIYGFNKPLGHFSITLHEIMHGIGLAHVEDPLEGDSQVPLMFPVFSEECVTLSDDSCDQNRTIDDCIRDAIRCMYNNPPDESCSVEGSAGLFLSIKSGSTTGMKILEWIPSISNNYLGFNIYYKMKGKSSYHSLNRKMIKANPQNIENTYTFEVEENMDKLYYLEVLTITGNLFLPF